MGILDTIMEENKREEDEEIYEENYSLIGSTCPHCKDGKMWPRQSKFGEFLGCSNFPRCAYTINEKYDNDVGTAGHKIV